MIPNLSDCKSDKDPTYEVGAKVLEDQAMYVHNKGKVSETLNHPCKGTAPILYHVKIQITNALKLISELIGKSDWTVPEWRATFFLQ